MHVLLLVDGLELNSVICVLSPACRASTVEVFFYVMPTETTDLGGESVNRLARVGGGGTEPDNHKGRAGSSSQRYPSPQGKAGILGLPGIDQTGKMSGCTGTGHQGTRRGNTHRFIIAPVRVLHARKDAGFGLYRCGAGLENGGGQRRMSTGSGRHCLCICLTERTTRSRIGNYSEQRRRAIGKGVQKRDGQTREFLARRPGVDHWSTQRFPRSRSHGPHGLKL